MSMLEMNEINYDIISKERKKERNTARKKEIQTRTLNIIDFVDVLHVWIVSLITKN